MKSLSWRVPEQILLSIFRVSQLWLRYAEITREKCLQVKLFREHYVTQPDHGKEVRKTWIRIRALREESKRESWSIPKTWVQVHACQQKINITSGCLQYPDIQNKTGMRIWRVLCGDVCRKLVEVAGTSKDNWDKLKESERETGWSCLDSQKESRWVPEISRLWRTEPEGRRIWSFSSANFSTHCSLLILTEWFWNSVAGSWSSLETGSWRRHQLCTREANVLS